MPHTPKKLRKLSGFDGSAEAMLQRPELAAMIAALASRATRIEDTFARLFVYLLNREEEANLAEYLKLIHRRIRMETFKEIAKGRLSEDDMTKFNKLAKDMDSKMKLRNDLVHGWWAVSDEYPDALLLIERTEYQISHFRYMHADFKDEAERLAYIDDITKNYTIRPYREKDFRMILDELYDYHGEVENFVRYAKVVR